MKFAIPVRLTKLKDTSKTALRPIEGVGNHTNNMSGNPKRRSEQHIDLLSGGARAKQKCGICKEEGQN